MQPVEESAQSSNIDFQLLKDVTVDKPFSTVLSLLVIMMSTVTKIPQIYKLHKLKSGRGISIQGTTLDLLSSTIYIFYNYMNKYPFRTWGESVFNGLQTLILCAQILTYENSPFYASVYVAGYGVVFCTFATGTVSIRVVSLLQSVNVLISLASKSMQIYKNYCNKDTGHLSLITPCLTFGGSVIRIFTSIKETNDTMIVGSGIASAIANFIICGQLFMYMNDENGVRAEE